MGTIIIPKRLANDDDLVVIPKKQFDELIASATDKVLEKAVLGWSRDARRLHRVGKLPKLVSLRSL
jgi:RNase P protein component